MAKKAKPTTELATLRAERSETRKLTKELANELNRTGSIVAKGKKQLARIVADVGDQNSTSRAAVTAVSATVIGQGLRRCLQIKIGALDSAVTRTSAWREIRE